MEINNSLEVNVYCDKLFQETVSVLWIWEKVLYTNKEGKSVIESILKEEASKKKNKIQASLKVNVILELKFWINL
jgi:hypothetical protein